MPNDTPPASPVATRSLRARLKRLLFFAFVIFAPAHLYVGFRLLPDLPLSDGATLLAVVWLGLSTLLIPFGTLARLWVRRQEWIDPLVWAGTLSMGWFSSLFILTLIRDLALIVPATRAWTEQSALLVLALSLLASAIGFVGARKTARVVRVSIPLDGLDPALEGFTIAQLSDIHVGPTIKGGYVRAIVKRVNGLKADMVAITGDVVDGPVERLASETAPLGEMKTRHGTYIVTGNHEFYSEADLWMDCFAKQGLIPLRNAHVVLDHDGASLVVAGVEDYTAGKFQPDRPSDPHLALKDAPEGVPRLLLAHQPRTAEAALAAGADVQLSGHTHGGQIWPWNYFVRMQQPFTAGLKRLGSLWVYTSRGTGYWGPPKRFGAPSEITFITLTRATQA